MLSLCFSFTKEHYGEDNFYSPRNVVQKNYVTSCSSCYVECPALTWGQNCENTCRCQSGECDNVIGCTSCSGYPGWTGPNCDQDIDECLDTTYCGPNSDCVNTNGSVICDCHSWYQRVSDQCQCKYCYCHDQ